MSPPLDILGVGIAAVDDVLYINDTPQPNAKYPVQESARHGGGLAAVAMVAAARLGAKAAFVARFDSGELSRYMTDVLAEQGVNTRHIIADSSAQPYHSIIVVDQATGSRTIFYDSRRFQQPAADDIPLALIRSAKVFFLDFLADPVPLELARKARAAGVPIVADIEGRHPEISPLLLELDHLIVSEEFAQWHTGQANLADACSALARAPTTPRAATLVTAGSRGCYLAADPAQPPTHIPAFSVATVDTTGCGDTFHGAYAFAIARNFSVLESTLIASACGALKATGRGWQAIPTSETLAAFLRQHHTHHPAIPAILDQLTT